VRIDGLEVRADGHRLLGPLDLEFERGAYVVLVGPSGSGKTTLLRAIAGLVTPAAGRVELFGETASLPGRIVLLPQARGVGMLFQGGALWPHMSVARTLHFALACAGVRGPERAARTASLLDAVSLPGYEDRMPATLSGGERQRLSLARALVASPRLLLLDEPLGPLDAELRASLMKTVGRLHREHGCTTIHVTHDPDEALGVATRTARLEAGRVARDGRSQEARA
jgi:ABC-type Fe3+/spermidine/putrescine transport system ATPase subunit